MAARLVDEGTENERIVLDDGTKIWLDEATGDVIPWMWDPPDGLPVDVDLREVLGDAPELTDYIVTKHKNAWQRQLKEERSWPAARHRDLPTGWMYPSTGLRLALERAGIQEPE